MSAERMGDDLAEGKGEFMQILNEVRKFDIIGFRDEDPDENVDDENVDDEDPDDDDDDV